MIRGDRDFFTEGRGRPARLWQGASQVEAPVLQFEQKTAAPGGAWWRRRGADGGPYGVCECGVAGCGEGSSAKRLGEGKGQARRMWFGWRAVT